jgi:hypothetical protein
MLDGTEALFLVVAMSWMPPVVDARRDPRGGVATGPMRRDEHVFRRVERYAASTPMRSCG